ncbi:MAG: (2Fe-2S)-binding protein, partial [Erythrobacter sp.]|nr:(2Fe-2S)-binding protein [Erythrobacter sp.]
DLWTVPDPASPNGRAMAKLIQEDTQFGEAIQRSMESRGFRSVPLSYQESRIYWFHQHCDRMIGPQNVPDELRVEQAIGEEWVSPNDPRVALMEQEADLAMTG